MLKKLSLCNGRRQVLSFVCDEGDFSISEVDFTDEEQLRILPRGLLLSYPVGTPGERLRYWLEERSASRTRHFGQLLAAARKSHPDRDPLLTLILATHFTSCHDTYWICDADEDLSWEEVSPYANPHDSVIPHLLFDGFSGRIDLSVPRICPDLTNPGLQPKHWERTLQGGLRLCIANGKPTDPRAPSETSMEFFAGQIASCLGFACVRTRLRSDALLGTVLVREGFTSEEFGLRGLMEILTTPALALEIPRFDLSDIELHARVIAPLLGADAYADMMVFDALTLNTNRHALNFGLIVNNATGAVQGMAPLYGHGRTLLYAAGLDDLERPGFVERYFKAHQRARLVNYARILPAFLQDRHLARLDALRAFTFSVPSDPRCQPDPRVMPALQELKDRAVDYALTVAGELRGGTGWVPHPVVQ